MHTDAKVTPPPFLSIKDAADRYQKAEITIRRFVRTIVEKEKSVERGMIHPLPKDADRLKKKKKPFSYTIAQDLLERHYGAAATINTTRRSGQHDDYRSLLEKMNSNLQAQLMAKDEQLRTLAKAIDGLSERQRETNILMKGLQEHLLLGAPEDVVEAKTVEKGRRKRWWRMW